MEKKTPNPLTCDLVKALNMLPPLSPNRCIYRVPKRLRCANQKAYTPQLVSIGPLHHGHESLAPMEEHKIRFVRDYLRRTNVSLEYLIEVIKNKEKELRSYYAERIGLSSDEFVKIVFVDALFIIELLLKFNYRDKSKMHELDYIFDRPYMFTDIKEDLVLLENQLPFFILDELFCKNIRGVKHSMIELSKIFFYGTLDNERTINISSQSNSFSTINHFVDLLIKFEYPMELEARQGNESATKLPTATKLHQSGIKFRTRKGAKLFDIRFSNGVLEIPKLLIFDSTELRLRNLIAFEQCHYEDKYVSDYVIFMSFLVHTCEDVELLVKYGIIKNCIGDNNRVAAMLYKLGDGVIRSEKFNFGDIFDQLNRHYERSWNKHKAKLKQNYFDSPWTTIKVIAASLIITLTFIQTVCSVISIVNADSPPH